MNKRAWLIGMLVVIGLLGGGIYYYKKTQQDSPPQVSEGRSVSPPGPQPPPPTVQEPPEPAPSKPPDFVIAKKTWRASRIATPQVLRAILIGAYVRALLDITGDRSLGAEYAPYLTVEGDDYGIYGPNDQGQLSGRLSQLTGTKADELRQDLRDIEEWDTDQWRDEEVDIGRGGTFSVDDAKDEIDQLTVAASNYMMLTRNYGDDPSVRDTQRGQIEGLLGQIGAKVTMIKLLAEGFRQVRDG